MNKAMRCSNYMWASYGKQDIELELAITQIYAHRLCVCDSNCTVSSSVEMPNKLCSGIELCIPKTIATPNFCGTFFLCLMVRSTLTFK